MTPAEAEGSTRVTGVSPVAVVVMGVAGSGKSTIGGLVARAIGARFVEGDELHPRANLEKMAAGVALRDDDRWPWLSSLMLVLRAEQPVVVTCSALRRVYRDQLRRVPGVRFLFLEATPALATARANLREGHFMSAEMVVGQFGTLERPDADEVDVTTIDAAMAPEEILRVAITALEIPCGAPSPLLDLRSDEGLTEGAIATSAISLVDSRLRKERSRVLLVPPDATRPHSRGAMLAGALFRHLRAAGHEVSVLPALGTHRPMAPAQVAESFGGSVPFEAVLEHRWREGLCRLGEIAAAEVEVLSGDRASLAVPIEVDDEILEGVDLVVSIGQVVPHEVAGMANFTKNLIVGLGGAATIGRTHFLGALCGIEELMGVADNPVRDVLDLAFDRFVAPRVNVLWLLTVIDEAGGNEGVAALVGGSGGSWSSGGAAFHSAARVSAERNVHRLSAPASRISVYLDPREFTSTWLGNKAVYRTRRAMATGGELVVLAPGIDRFGEDERVDQLIRRHGYRGRDAVLIALERDRELAGELSAAAHLIHGSSEGRFRVVYCTDPDAGGLTPDELESVGYGWRPLSEELQHLGVDAETPTGLRRDARSQPFFHVANPALGLWSADRQGAATAS